jgi:membrane-bound lytic murein transglycosylase D
VKIISKRAEKKDRPGVQEGLAEKPAAEERLPEIVLAANTEDVGAEYFPEKTASPEPTSGELETAVEVAFSDSLSGTAVILGDFQVEQVAEQNGSKMAFINVEAWETLGHYADWLEVQTSQIRKLNKFRFGRPIKTSQKIRIPLNKVSKDLFEERRYEFHKGIEEDFFAAYKVVETQTYTVKRGDTVWAICHEELDLPFWLIKKYNSLIVFDRLQPNQVLVVPVVEKVG